MKDAKFRVWTGMKMEHNVVVGQLGAFYVAGIDPKDSACLSPNNTKYPDETPVMQFTGLHDRNGNEIYEGDVLQDDEGLGVAVWSDQCGGWLYIFAEDYPSQFGDQLGDFSGDESKVIGNIYEHPHLLGAK